MLANERTFAGWMRTGMAALGMAVAIEAIFKETEPTWLAKSAATLFVCAAALVFLGAYRKSRQTADRLTAHASHPMAVRNLLMLTILFVAGALFIGLLLWFL